MIAGFVLGFLTFLSSAITFHKLPLNAQSFLKKHRLLADVGIFALTWLTLSAVSKSIVAIFGATVAGLLVDFGFMSIEFLEDNPEVKQKLKTVWDNRTQTIKRNFKDYVLSLPD